jgi:hypothetical protein
VWHPLSIFSFEPMRNFHFTHSIRNMFMTIGGFVVAILLLESDGLENWANRLEPGPLRSLAYPASSALNRTLQPFGVAGTRDRVLDEAARMGWSDDAVRLARMTPPTTEQPAASQPRIVGAGISSTSPGIQIHFDRGCGGSARWERPTQRRPYAAGANRTGQAAGGGPYG